MAEKLLSLMADLDDASQARMSAWYGALRDAGFPGTQTPGLPYHISLAAFLPDEERRATETMEKAAAVFPELPVRISHIGIFAPGRVLFGAPEMSEGLRALRAACESENDLIVRPWTPHVTVLIDEPETVLRALPLFEKVFEPFEGRIVRLHLCAFWPTREIGIARLSGK